jgi:hypothetical protein
MEWLLVKQRTRFRGMARSKGQVQLYVYLILPSNAYVILVESPEWNRPAGRTKHRLEGNMALIEVKGKGRVVPVLN